MATTAKYLHTFLLRHFAGKHPTSSFKTALATLGVATDGTQEANKFITTDSNANQGIAKVTALHIGTSGSETEVTASVAEINQGANMSLRGEILTGTETMTATDNGKVFFLNAATEFATTLPLLSTISAGWHCKFLVMAAASGADYTLVEHGSDSGKIVFEVSENDTTTSTDGEYSATGSTVTFTNAGSASVAGDFIEVYSDGTFWYIWGHARKNQGMAIS